MGLLNIKDGTMENHSGTVVRADVLRSLIISASLSGSKPSSSKGSRTDHHKEISPQGEVAVLRSPVVTRSATAGKAFGAGRIRLTHSAPREKLPPHAEKQGSEGKDTPPSATKTQRNAVFLNIAQRKDILPVTTVSLRRDVNVKGSETGAMKQQTSSSPHRGSPRLTRPARSRSESPNKKKPQLEVHFRPERVTEAFFKKDNRLVTVSDSSESTISDRKVVSVARCEVFALTDKSNKLNRPTSKSSNSINMVPRPVAGFPSKPMRSGAFMIGRRKTHADESSSTAAIAGQVLSEDADLVRKSELSVYSCERRQKDAIVLPRSSFPSDKAMALKLDHRYGILNSSLMLTKSSMDSTPVPNNSCKTSMVGSDIFMVQDSGMETKDMHHPISAALENLLDDVSEVGADKFTSQRKNNTATTKTLGTPSKSMPTTRETSKYSSLTKDSKSSSSTQKSQNMQNKYQSAQERYKSIIMDIYKKKGKDVQVLQNPMWKQGLSRGNSFGSKEEIKPVKGSGNKRQSSLGDLRKVNKGPKVSKEGHIGGKKINPKPLSILGSQGGRDVIFSPIKGLEIAPDMQPEAVTMKLKNKSKESVVVDTVKVTDGSSKEPQIGSKEKPGVLPKGTNKENDMKLEEVDEMDECSDSSDTDCDAEPMLQGTSSFKKINAKLSTKMVDYGADNTGEAMFTAGHYVDFQHAKFNHRNPGKPAVKIPSTSYTEDVKTKFLKVKVGGTPDGKSLAE